MSEAHGGEGSADRFGRLLVAITASLALVVGLAFGATAIRWYTLRGVGTIRQEFFTREGGTSYPSGECSERPCNYLLLGSDSRTGLPPDQLNDFGTNSDIGGETRADTIMLVHTDPALEKAIVLSFPRDLWVDIPGHGKDKINSAFEGGVDNGGPQLMADTVSDLTGLPIDHFLYVDLNGFQRVVDTLRGVDLCIPEYDVNTPGYVEGPDGDGQPTQIYYDEPGHIVDPYTGLDVTPGCQHLDGFQALAFVRSRHLPCDDIPDFARIGRQQQFMRAVINQMLKPAQIVKAPTLVQPILANLHRDQRFMPGDLVNLVGKLQGLSTGAVEFRAVPGTSDMVGSLSVVKMDPSARQLFHAIEESKPIAGVGTELVRTPPSEANTTVAVMDAGNADGAAEVEDVLSQAGFDISPGIVAGTVPKGVKPPVIVYQPGRQDFANVVHAYFPDLRMQKLASLEAPVAVVVPAGYVPLASDGGGNASNAAPANASRCPDPSA